MPVESDVTGALTVAERTRAEAEAVSADGGRPLRVSIGAVTCPDDPCSPDKHLDEADWAMYAAKRAGRNCVLAFSDGMVV